MAASLMLVSYLVREYDEAIAWFTGVLGFRLLEDTPRPGEAPGKRWVRVAPPSGGAGEGAALLLARAASPAQTAAIGQQAGGRVWLFLETDDFACDHAALTARGVEFLEVPRRESYGMVAVFRDLYGNKWDLIERSAAEEREQSRTT